MIDWTVRLLRRLPSWGIALVALGGVALVVGGAVFGYRTYDYIEHDNEFCLSCHLMERPYELFAESAHRGMGCKACHKPTFAARSQMALTQIIENPDSLETHAEVPNEKCAACHIEGDPERWESIRNSAGHRIHLESPDSALQGLNCVECHSTSLHQFAAASETCSQSGCHEDSGVQLGAMSDLAIHCTACHGFSDPVPEETSLEVATAAVRPDARACLSCHAMRVLVDLPDDEPHDAVCGTCHNPHEQEEPADADRTCATAGCHAQPDTLTPMHRGLTVGALDDCSSCHEAHHWEIEPEDCLGCHQDIFQDGSAGGDGGAAPTPFTVQAVDTTFTHDEHRSVTCTSCHSTEGSHGRITLIGLRDCRSCHHTAPVMDDCAACHAAGSGPIERFQATRTLDFTVIDPVDRALPFDHPPHDELACGECHTDGLTLEAGRVDCAGCHEDHHDPEVRCASCHVEAPEDAHSAEVHVGCGGSGCHTEVPAALASIPRTRPFCLTCHQDLEDHRPGQECEQCHQLPAPRGGGRAPGTR